MISMDGFKTSFEERVKALGLVLPELVQPSSRLPVMQAGSYFHHASLTSEGLLPAPKDPIDGQKDKYRFAPYAVNAVQARGFIYLSGKGPSDEGGKPLTGQVGTDLSVHQAYEHARNVALTHLAVLKQELGSLERVRRVVKILGMVNAAPDFTQHSEVINGWSDVFVNVFGEIGRHARSAVGMSSLPRGISVEVEAIIEIHSEQVRRRKY